MSILPIKKKICNIDNDNRNQSINSSEDFSLNSCPFKNSKILRKDEYPKMDGSTALLPLMAQFRSDILGIPIDEAENDLDNIFIQANNM